MPVLSPYIFDLPPARGVELSEGQRPIRNGKPRIAACDETSRDNKAKGRGRGEQGLSVKLECGRCHQLNTRNREAITRRGPLEPTVG